MPECIVCGEEFSEKRAELGYQTCLEHGEAKKDFIVAPAFNKGGYQLISPDDIKSVGK